VPPALLLLVPDALRLVPLTLLWPVDLEELFCPFTLEAEEAALFVVPVAVRVLLVRLAAVPVRDEVPERGAALPLVPVLLAPVLREAVLLLAAVEVVLLDGDFLAVDVDALRVVVPAFEAEDLGAVVEAVDLFAEEPALLEDVVSEPVVFLAPLLFVADTDFFVAEPPF
jgi:hypothetical protein